jgi:hypothetical protein
VHLTGTIAETFGTSPLTRAPGRASAWQETRA